MNIHQGKQSPRTVKSRLRALRPQSRHPMLPVALQRDPLKKEPALSLSAVNACFCFWRHPRIISGKAGYSYRDQGPGTKFPALVTQ